MKWRWLFVGAVAVVGGCGGALSIAAHNDAADFFRKNRETLVANVQKSGPRFRSDLRMLSAKPQLAKRNGNDCGALLLEKIPYPDPSDRFHYAHVVPEKIADALDACVPLKFPAKLDGVDVGGVDTSWMAQLATCDQWDMFTAPAVAAQRPLHLDTMPLPSLREARRWAMVRLVQGLRDGHAKEAGHDVENLARLMVTSEIGIVEASASELFDLDRFAWKAAQAQGADVDGWVPLEKSETEALSRVHFVWPAFTDVHASLDIVGADLFTSPDFAVGRCAAIQEGARVLLQIESIAPDAYGDAHALVTKALAATDAPAVERCRLTRTREAWDRAGQQSVLVGNDSVCNPDDGSCVFTSIAGHLPGLREAMVEELGTRDDALAQLGQYDRKR